MKDFIACCGLDCELCEARLATINDDNALRKQVAEHWSQLNGVEITPGMINCTGCRIDGVKTPFCESLCPIRQCVKGKGFDTCGVCSKMESCDKLGMIIRNNPDALKNLKFGQLYTKQMETDRILLRPWHDTDAEVLFKYASDPDVGSRAGWPPHKSVEESLEIIRTVFHNDTTWAIELKETGEAVGAIGYGPSCDCNLPAREAEPIVGYWIAKPYWNQGICTEALRLMLDYISQTTDIPSLISGHFIDNPASGRVMEKCGFIPTGETCVDENQYQGKDRPIRVLRLKLA